MHSVQYQVLSKKQYNPKLIITMKSYLCIAAILSVFVFVQCELAPDLQAHVDECLKEFELSEDYLKSPTFKDDPKMGCLGACVMKKGDRFTEGKIAVDTEMKWAAKYMPEKIDDTLEENFTACVDKANEEKDECAIAGSFSKCVIDKYGLPKL